MTFEQFVIAHEGSEMEQEFFQYMKNTAPELEQGVEKALKFPIVGKVLRALNALAEANSFAQFKQTSHYNNLKNWEFSYTPEKGLSVNPGEKHREIIKNVLIVGGVVLLGLLLFRKTKKKRL